ncbi:MAG: phosphoribosylformylglycinamidine cyclo-ligase, partial [Thaumarchaeota archaeon]|nr:phosphoribosylformylglycinamidine cyclo-ligase [Nitrososphaerota archaeon]
LIENQDVEKEEMYKTFNMGIGFCVIAPEDEEERIDEIFKKYGLQSRQIGEIKGKNGVFVDSLKIA